jgi:hypothetical protein
LLLHLSEDLGARQNRENRLAEESTALSRPHRQ